MRHNRFHRRRQAQELPLRNILAGCDVPLGDEGACLDFAREYRRALRRSPCPVPSGCTRRIVQKWYGRVQSSGLLWHVASEVSGLMFGTEVYNGGQC